MFLRGDGVLDGERHPLLTWSWCAAHRLDGGSEQGLHIGGHAAQPRSDAALDADTLGATVDHQPRGAPAAHAQRIPERIETVAITTVPMRSAV
ncbi:hypothetical protein GCM10025883_12890 [Mobilicoccus caccae]|uniref:Uncharacterized protein n=1 Tax=Mobilicoccus caccae TaxID=1859295 RepID=A0ABQ6IP59_9MICO|nr:hypothetical protein GCM10025883_12890 [Mobilicoccus caccae]